MATDSGYTHPALGHARVGKSICGLQFLLEGAQQREPGLYVTLEEGPEQLLTNADALGLPLRAAVHQGLIRILYFSREYIRTGPSLTVLADELTALHARRVVLDAATQMLTEHVDVDELRHILYKLVVTFKMLDIASVLRLEAVFLYSTESVTDMGLSPFADNLLMLRYAETRADLVPTLTIVKTRGSAHDRGTHFLVAGAGGMHVEASLSGASAPGAAGAEDETRLEKRRERGPA